MPAFKDLTGLTFGRLTALERVENDKHGKARFKCRCSCGAEVIVRGYDLRSGNTTSCGCLNREKTIERSTTHGMARTKIYNVWFHIKARCLNPNDKRYKDYGGRGITMFSEWIDSFQNFYSYVSKLEHFNEPGYSLDRIDNNRGYFPGNLRFANRKTQNRNQRKNVIVEYNGVEMSLAEASEKSGIKYGALQSRYYHGDRGDRLFRPVKK